MTTPVFSSGGRMQFVVGKADKVTRAGSCLAAPQGGILLGSSNRACAAFGSFPTLRAARVQC